MLAAGVESWVGKGRQNLIAELEDIYRKMKGKKTKWTLMELETQDVRFIYIHSNHQTTTATHN